MDLSTATTRAREIAEKTLRPTASAHDKDGTFSKEAVAKLGEAGLLGVNAPRPFAEVTAILSEADASVGMVYTMHVCAAQVIAAAKAKSPAIAAVHAEIANGKHLSTLAFSEAGSRSHFWAPVSKAEKTPGGARITAKKSFCTSAGQADSYVVTTLSADAKGPTDSTLWLVPKSARGLTVASKWDGMGLRANASAPMTLEAVDVAQDHRLTDECGGFKAKLDIVMPWFCLGSSAVSLGICRAAVGATITHLKSSRFEHMGNMSIGEALPNLRAQLAEMQIETDGLAHRVADLVTNLETPGPLTMLRVLESKAAAAENAVKVTSLAMRTCGGAAFSKHTSIERFFRDAHAGTVMAPTVDHLRDFIGKALLEIPLF
jgi:alkylation response protein AidB-like acyl-CoA dehydrogenase